MKQTESNIKKYFCVTLVILDWHVEVISRKSTYCNWFWKRAAIWTILAEGLSKQLHLRICF